MSAEPPISQDPDVLKEEKKNRIWHLRMERWMEAAKAVSVILQAFKAEAVSLVSGIGTLVVGWYHIRKVILAGRKAVKQESQVAESVAVPKLSSSKHMVQHKALVEIPMPVPPLPVETPILADPFNYFSVLVVVAFIWSSIALWLKRRRAAAKSVA